MNASQATSAQQTARELLAEASVLPETRATRLDGDKMHTGKPQAAAPMGEALGLYDILVARFKRCSTTHDFETFNEWARTEINSVKKAPTPIKIPFKTRILTEWEGHTDAEVARVTNTPRTTVRRWREEAGLDPQYGRRQQAA